MTKSLRALLVSSTPAKQHASLRVLGAVAHEVVVVRSPAQLAGLDGFALVVVDVDGLDEAARRDLLDLVSMDSQSRIIVLSEQTWGLSDVDQFILNSGASVVIGGSSQRDRELFISAKKILTGDIFGLSKYFGWGVDVVDLSLTSSARRQSAIEFAVSFASRVHVHSRVLGHIVTALDELVTNAFFNAPVDENGCHAGAARPRSDVITLPASKAISVGLCTDGACLGLSVADPFGSLEPHQLRRRLFGEMPGRRLQVVRSTPGGAGIGLFQTISGVSRIVFNLREGTQTEVIALFDLTRSYRDYARPAKSMSLFTASRSHPDVSDGRDSVGRGAKSSAVPTRGTSLAL
jgi:hypothetical protein